MRLLELEIRRLPGIDGPFRLEPGRLGAGVNVVFGPNGIGKSSILRALRTLWWPEIADTHGVSVEAHFESEGHTWQAERDGASLRWQRDGVRAQPPALPEAHLEHCFLIGLGDLAADGDASWFTERVRLALADDYDIRAARRRLFELQPRHGHTQAKAWEEARVGVLGLEREQRALLDQVRDLDELEAALARATAAQAELARLELAQEWVAQRSEVEGLDLRLAAYPAGMARLPSDASERLEELDDQIADLERRCAQREHECAQLDQQRAATGLNQALAAAELDEQREAMQQLRRTEEELGELDLEIAELQARRTAASGDPPASAADVESLERAASALREWLAAPSQDTGGRLRWLPHAVAVLAAVTLGLQVNLLWFALLILLVLDLVWRVRRANHGTSRDTWRQQFELTAQAAPQTWDRPGVQLRLRELERRVAESEQAARAAEGDLAGRQARRGALETQRDERADALGAWLAALGEEVAAEGGALERGLAALEARTRTWEQVHERRATAQRDLNERRAELEGARRRRTLVFERVGLGSEEREELGRWIESRGEWSRLSARRASLVEGLEKLEARRSAIGGHPDESAQGLDARLADVRKSAAERDELFERTTQLRANLDKAGRGRSLEEAQVHVEQERDRLEDAWQQAALGLAGRILIEDVEGEHAVTARPAVLEHARELFAVFTHGRYTLDVRDHAGQALLMAEDTSRSGQGVAPGELSDGTRAQLLLAIRLAHVLHAGPEGRLPLFLDDALATSDAERTREVATSLFELAARDQRQVFLLLRDESDARLIAACGADAMVIDLGKVRGRQSAITDRARLAPPRRRVVPELTGNDPAEWAREHGVEPLDPWRGVEAAHLYWMLVEEPELLGELWTWGLERVGPLRELVATGAADFLDDAQRARIERAARVFEAVRRGWLIGRGQALTREDLEGAGVSSVFIERITELSAELGHDAKRLVAAIEQKSDDRSSGFRTQTLESVRANLEQSGHLDPRDVLDEDQAWQQFLTDLREADRKDPSALRAHFEFLRGEFDRTLAP